MVWRLQAEDLQWSLFVVVEESCFKGVRLQEAKFHVNVCAWTNVWT